MAFIALFAFYLFSRVGMGGGWHSGGAVNLVAGACLSSPLLPDEKTNKKAQLITKSLSPPTCTLPTAAAPAAGTAANAKKKTQQKCLLFGAKPRKALLPVHGRPAFFFMQNLQRPNCRSK